MKIDTLKFASVSLIIPIFLGEAREIEQDKGNKPLVDDLTRLIWLRNGIYVLAFFTSMAAKEIDCNAPSMLKCVSVVLGTGTTVGLGAIFGKICVRLEKY